MAQNKMTDTEKFLKKNLIKRPDASILPYQLRNNDFISTCTNKEIKVYFYFFQYLEGCYLIGPSINIFKLSMLNK